MKKMEKPDERLAMRVWGELAQPDENAIVVRGPWATQHRGEPRKQAVVPETYPRLGAVEVLFGAGGLYVSLDALIETRTLTADATCVLAGLIPLSAFFLYCGAMELRNYFKYGR